MKEFSLEEYLKNLNREVVTSYTNNDPFAPWNTFDKDNPSKPWNGYDTDNPLAPWNNPLGYDYTGRYEKYDRSNW